MGMMKKAGALGVAKLIFNEAKKPQNQARLKRVVQTVKDRRNQGPAR